MTTSGGLPTAAYALALSLLPGAGPVSLGRLLAAGDPERAWADVVAGRACRPPAGRPAAKDRIGWETAARRLDIAGAWRRARAAGIGVTWWGQSDYPVALQDDPLPPAVVFWRGTLDGLDRPCVALVGTRHATPEGRAIAFELGHDLAEAGVCVISGLALGIDGASHRGALASGRPGATVGVAASGVDRPYPTRHTQLWQQVAGTGAVVAETPPGHPAQTWRFPARNRIIAGLSSMVVVVESHAAGGSLITADAAIQRGIDVRAVPGPVRSPASAGTNQLLYDGPGPVRDATDILMALGTAGPTAAGPAARPRSRPAAPPPAASFAGRAERPHRREDLSADTGLGPSSAPHTALLGALGWQPRTLNWIAAHTDGDMASIATGLEQLAATGQIREERGWWQRLV